MHEIVGDLRPISVGLPSVRASQVAGLDADIEDLVEQNPPVDEVWMVDAEPSWRYQYPAIEKVMSPRANELVPPCAPKAPPTPMVPVAST